MKIIVPIETKWETALQIAVNLLFGRLEEQWGHPKNVPNKLVYVVKRATNIEIGYGENVPQGKGVIITSFNDIRKKYG